MSTQRATATLVVQYQSSAADGSIIIAEIDQDKHPSSSFAPGSNVFFRVYANCEYDLFLSDTQASVSTSISSATDNIEDEVINFISTKEAAIKYPYASGWNFSWWGNNGYPIPVAPSAGTRSMQLVTPVSKEEIEIVAAGKVNYNSTYRQFRLAPGSSAEGYTLIVLILERI